MVAHRGASGWAPENTLVGFELAIEQGADFLECDVHLARDGRLVVIHDDTVDRTTDGHGQVRDFTVAELQRLDAGSWLDPRFRGTRLPTLDELLTWAKGRVPIAIELKQPDVPYVGYEAAAVEAIVGHGMLDQVLVISFDHALLARIAGIDGRVATGMIYGPEAAPADPVAAALAIGAQAIHPRFDLVTPEFVRAAHAADLAISVWTLDPRADAPVAGEPAPTERAARPPRLSAARIEATLRTGLDSAASNYPNRLRAIIERMPAL